MRGHRRWRHSSLLGVPVARVLRPRSEAAPVGTRNFYVALNLFPFGREDVALSTSWLCVAYRARVSGSPLNIVGAFCDRIRRHSCFRQSFGHSRPAFRWRAPPLQGTVLASDAEDAVRPLAIGDVLARFAKRPLKVPLTRCLGVIVRPAELVCSVALRFNTYNDKALNRTAWAQKLRCEAQGGPPVTHVLAPRPLWRRRRMDEPGCVLTGDHTAGRH